MRVVNTNLTIDNGQTAAQPTYYGTASWNGVDSNVIPVETKRSYTDVLPSFNFTLDVTDQQKVRFGAARVVSPQDLFSLGLGNSYNFTRQTNARVNINTGQKDGFAFAGGSSGNPQLDPTAHCSHATSISLSHQTRNGCSGDVMIVSRSCREARPVRVNQETRDLMLSVSRSP